MVCVGAGEGAKSNSENNRFPFLSHACAGSYVLAVGVGVTHHLKLFSQSFPYLPFWSKCLHSQPMPSSWLLYSSPSTTGEDLSEEGAENHCER